MYELTEKFSTALLIMLGLLIFAKHGRKLLMMLKGKEDESDGHKHLDKMIKRNELMFRGTLNTPKASNKNVPIKDFKSQLEHYASGTNSKDEKKSAEYLLKLLIELNWGEGKEISRLSKKINSLIPIPVGNNDIKVLIKSLLEQNLFFPYPKSDRILANSDLENYLTIYAFIYKLRSVVIDNKYSSYESMLKINSKSLKNTILHFFSLLEGKNFPSSIKDIFHQIINSNKLIKGKALPYYCIYIFDEKNRLLSLNDLMSIWKKCFSFWYAISPLPKSNDHEFILELLNCKKTDSEETIKKKYNTELKMRHPDRFTSYKLPGEYEKILTENFQILQTAYSKFK